MFFLKGYILVIFPTYRIYDRSMDTAAYFLAAALPLFNSRVSITKLDYIGAEVVTS